LTEVEQIAGRAVLWRWRIHQTAGIKKGERLPDSFTLDEVKTIIAEVMHPAPVQLTVDLDVPLHVGFGGDGYVDFIDYDPEQDPKKTRKLFEILASVAMKCDPKVFEQHPEMLPYEEMLTETKRAQQAMKDFISGKTRSSIGQINTYLSWISPRLNLDGEALVCETSIGKKKDLVKLTDVLQSREYQERWRERELAVRALSFFVVQFVTGQLGEQPLKKCPAQKKGCKGLFLPGQRGPKAKTCPNNTCQQWARRHLKQRRGRLKK